MMRPGSVKPETASLDKKRKVLLRSSCLSSRNCVRTRSNPLLEEEENMATQNSFDIVSTLDLQEVKNAIDQAMKEISQRFDFKGSKSTITLEGKEIVVLSDDEYKLKSVIDILQSKLVKRGISLKALTYQKVEQALGGTVRQKISLQEGIPQEKAKEIVKEIKGTKIKVQAQIQGDQLRVIGKNKDDLQEVIKFLKGKDFGIDMQFTNYR
jgi:uncharacterized protein YajQ (UPF0234 family)